jgi:hypothetical protein
MTKEAKKAKKKVEDKHHQWIYETTGKYVPGGVSNYIGKLKDEGGKIVVIIREDMDYNQLSRLLNTSKIMSHARDMKGLSTWCWQRGLVPMAGETEEDREAEKAMWNKKKIIPLDIKEVIL